MSSAERGLPITVLDVPGGARLGLMHCPGRCGGAYGQRHLVADLDAVEAFGADIMITLVEANEFAHLGVTDFEAMAERRSFRWHHVPIPDYGVPSFATWSAWDTARGDVHAVIKGGGRIALHCAAGLGRTGMIAAKLLSELGFTPQAAIVEVRRLRPGAIETEAQVAFVLDGPRLL